MSGLDGLGWPNPEDEPKTGSEREAERPLDAAAFSPCDIANGLLHAADDHPCCKATLHAAANLLANMPPANGPLRQAYSREEMRDASVKWMIEQFGIPKEMDDDERDRWHTRCGLLYHFIYDHFPAENAIGDGSPSQDSN